MKRYFSRLFIAALAAGSLFVGCAEKITDEEQKPVAPVVESYLMGEDEIQDGAALNVTANASVRFEAKMQTTGPVDCAWYVTPEGGEETKVASTPAFTYMFPQIGDYTIRFSASNSEGETGASWTVTAAGIPIKVDFDNNGESIAVKVLEAFTVTATVTEGNEGVEHKWQLDGETISTDATLNYTISDPGRYTLTYEGKNAYNSTVTRIWTVNASDKPLAVEFSIPGPTLTCTEGLPVRITANVITGNVSVVHSWKLDGQEVSAEEMLNYTFETSGTHTLTYSAINELEETVEEEWNVTVETYYEGTIVNDCEDVQQILFRGGNVALVDNEWKTDINGSDKVLSVVPYAGNGIGLFNVGGGGSTPNITFPNTTRILRIKILMPTEQYYPILSWTATSNDRVFPTKVNGQPFDAATMTEADFQARLYDAGEWNILEYSTPAIARQQIQLGPFVIDLKKSGANMNGKTVYYDDLEYLTTEDIQ